MVQPGYPRCPRCTMPLPENRKRTEAIAGATTVGQDSQNYLWIGLGALVLLAVGIGYASIGGGNAKATVAEPSAEARSLGTAPRAAAANTAAPEDDDQVGISLDDAPPTESEKRQNAVSGFEQSLSAGRLWATISVDGADALSLVSGACSDDGMQPAISRASASLKAVGFTTIRCLEKHGAQVFEQGL